MAADLITGYPFNSARFTNDRAGIRLLRGDNVAQGFIRWDGVRRWPTAEGLDTFLLKPGDVILAMDRPWIEAGLKYATLTDDDCPSLLVQRVACLRALPGLDQRFLGYIIRSQAFTDYVLGVQTGTAVPHISGGQIRAYAFQLPAPELQKNAADLLGALDDKIDLNRRMAETLEAMVRALFKSWFVEFAPVHARATSRPTGLSDNFTALFPDGFDEDGLPIGWTKRPISALGHFLNGLALQKFPAADGEAFLPVIKIAELRVGPTPKSDRASVSLPPEYVVGDGDHLFSWSGSLTHCRWSHGIGALNQHLFKVTAQACPSWFLYQAVEYFLPEFRAIASEKAVTMGHIQRRHLDQATIAVPPPALMDAADRVLCPMHDRVLTLALQCRTLTLLRDALLPKLISGELRIAEAEQRVAAA